MEELDILVVYATKHGSTALLAEMICNGVEDVPGCNARLRTVMPINGQIPNPIELPENGPPYADQKDLRECAGIIIGSPTRQPTLLAAIHILYVALKTTFILCKIHIICGLERIRVADWAGSVDGGWYQSR